MRSLNVIYEDNHLLVIEKPVNMPSQEDSSGDLDVLSAAKLYVKDKYGKKGDAFLGLVHRLDRPVGGLMVFARTSKAASRLSEQIRNNAMKKYYIAILEGSLPADTGELTHYIIKNTKDNIVAVYDEPAKDSKKAILVYNVIRRGHSDTIVGIDLVTGRPHQIRAQFSHIGHPVLGDKKYGAKRAFAHNGIALYSSRLEFKHPVKDETMRFELLPEWCDEIRNNHINIMN